MTTEDQFVLILVSSALLFVVAHILKEEPKNPLLAAAIISLCLASIARRLLFS